MDAPQLWPQFCACRKLFTRCGIRALSLAYHGQSFCILQQVLPQLYHRDTKPLTACTLAWNRCNAPSVCNEHAAVLLSIRHPMLHGVHACKGVVTTNISSSQQIASVAVQGRVWSSVAHQREYGLQQ